MTTQPAPATISFDHRDPGFARNPYEFYASVRETPIFWSPLYGGFWVVTDYESVRQVAVDDGTFLSARTTGRTERHPLISICKAQSDRERT